MSKMSMERKNELSLCEDCRGVGFVFYQNAQGEYDCEACIGCAELYYEGDEEECQIEE